MISEYQFRILNLEQQAEFLFEDGEYVHQREHNDNRINLYALNGFFVETWYSIKEDEIFDIKVVDSELVEAHYLDTIKVNL